jgi:hypothetical protein
MCDKLHDLWQHSGPVAESLHCSLSLALWHSLRLVLPHPSLLLLVRCRRGCPPDNILSGSHGPCRVSRACSVGVLLYMVLFLLLYLLLYQIRVLSGDRIS